MAMAQRNGHDLCGNPTAPSLDGHDRPAARGTVQRLGLLLGLSALLILVAAPTFETFTAHAARRLDQPPDHPHVLEVAGGMQMTLALMAVMVLWWITEAVPIPVTALLPGVLLLPLLHARRCMRPPGEP